MFTKQAKYLLFTFLLLVLFGGTANGNEQETSNPILIISSYNPATYQTTVTISDFMDEYCKQGGKYRIEIENMNCKNFSESPKWNEVMYNILSKYEGKKEPRIIILLGQEAWAAYLSQDNQKLRHIPVMCSLVSRNGIILPEDSIDLKQWMPESVDFFSDNLKKQEVCSSFLYEYDILKNIRLIRHFYPKTRHIAFISDNTYGGVSMQALVRKEMKNFPI